MVVGADALSSLCRGALSLVRSDVMLFLFVAVWALFHGHPWIVMAFIFEILCGIFVKVHQELQ
jgi:hypothetical protein